MITFILNDQTIQTTLPPGSSLLDFVRYHRYLVGTKIGCREGDCGACTVLVGEWVNDQLRYRSMTSCLMPLGNAQGKHIVTVEGLNMDDLTPVQQAIVDEGGSQCGFCTPGFVVSLTGHLLNLPEPTGDPLQLITSMDGNICRCTGYKSLERAAGRIARQLSQLPLNYDMGILAEQGFVPRYFTDIHKRLQDLSPPLERKGSSNGQGVLLGGGTDLLVQRPDELADLDPVLVFDRQELRSIRELNGHIQLGAAVTAEDMQDSALMLSVFPKLRDFMKLVSSTPIRNMGTLAGNLVNASPIGDLTIFFLALDSSIVLVRQGTKRKIALRDFYKGYKVLDKAPDEIVESVLFKIPEPDDHFNFEKVSKRTHLDIASVNSACWIKTKDNVIREAHLSAGGVGPVPLYLAESSAALQGQPVSPDTLKRVVEVMQEEISPISDARGSAAYKRLLLRQLFFGHFLAMTNNSLHLKELI